MDGQVGGLAQEEEAEGPQEGHRLKGQVGTLVEQVCTWWLEEEL